MPATPVPAHLRRFTSSGDFMRAELDEQRRISVLVAVDDLDGVDLATLEPEEAAELGAWLLRRAVEAMPDRDLRALAGDRLDSLTRYLGRSFDRGGAFG